MSLTRLFLQRPTLAFVFIALTLVAAVMALRSIVIQELPNAGLPSVSVNASYSGASTTELVTEIAEPIEDQLAGTPYLQSLDTTIASGTVSITAQFSVQSTDTENIANVEKALQAAQRQLPSTIQAPTLRVANPSETVVVSLALVSKKYSQPVLAAIANNTIVPAIEQVAGVSNVVVTGTTQPAFMVTVDPGLLAANNLTLTDVVNSITPNNLRAPGGYVYGPGRETALDIRGDLPNVQAVANLPIHVAYTAPGGASTGSAGGSGGAAGSSGGGAAASGSAASSGGGQASGGASAGSASGGSSAGSASGGSAAGGTSGGTSSGGASSGSASGASGTVRGIPNVNLPSTSVAQSSAGSVANATVSPIPLATSAPAPVPGGNYSSTSGTTSGSATSGTSAGASTSGGTASGSGGTTSGGSTSGGATSGSTTAGGTAARGASSRSANGSTSGSASGTGTTTGGASGSSGSGAAYAGGTTSSSSSATASNSAAAAAAGGSSLPIDQPLTPTTSTSNSATDTASSGAAALPSGSSSAFGSGSGTSLSPFVGEVGRWEVPSADKRISDVATVVDGAVVQRVFSSENGRSGVTLLIQKESQSSEVTVADAVLKQLPALRAKFPGVDFQLAHNQSIYTEQQVESVEHTLIEGIILTAIVMLFFLGSWRNAVVVMVAIPTSLGVTLFVMDVSGLTLDTISLMAMTLVIGILIDDSTVVLENIERHRSLGEEPADAALNGRSEIGLAAIVLTLVDVIVFLPIAFAPGQVGQYLHEFAIVITVATLTSLFVSFTLTPTLAGLWSMKSTWKPWQPIRWFSDRFDGLRSRYSERWLPFALKYPWPFVIGPLLLTIAAFLLVPTGLVGEEFIPPADQGILTAQVSYPPGHPLAQTHATMAKLEAELRQVIPSDALGFETTVSGAYSAAFGGFVQEGNVGQISAYLSGNTKPTSYYVQLLQQRLPRLAPGASVIVTAATGTGGSAQQPIDELVSTSDGSDPTPYAAKVFVALQNTPGTTGAQDSASNAAPQMEVNFNRAALQALDVSDGTAAAAVEAAFGGDVASTIETPDRGLTDIEVIYPQSAQTQLDDVLAVPLRNNNGGIVRLGDVASLQYVPAPLLITRENRANVIHVSANLAGSANLSDTTKTFGQRVKQLNLPKSVTVHPAALGQQDLMSQALLTLGGSLLISILLVFLVIVALYNSYRTPFVTLFAIPVAAIGALGALWITHQTLNLYSMIGTVLLVGLVTKNGILLVDYADGRRLKGKSRRDGIVEAAQTRFRPIIMTTFAMVAGMLPLALGLEPGGGQRASLAIVVIGGLLSSLVLTLVIVPIMYVWIAPVKLREKTKFADSEPAAAPA